MTNVWANIHMKKCCQEALGALDKARGAGDVTSDPSAKASKKKAAAEGPSLRKDLGDLPVQQSTPKAALLHAQRSPLVTVHPKARETWTKIARAHHDHHKGAGDEREATFWEGMLNPPAVYDLSVHPDVNAALAERINTNKLQLGGEGDPEGSALMKKIQGITGKVKPGNEQVLFKVKSLENGGYIWLGGGKLDKPFEGSPDAFGLKVVGHFK